MFSIGVGFDMMAVNLLLMAGYSISKAVHSFGRVILSSHIYRKKGSECAGEFLLKRDTYKE